MIDIAADITPIVHTVRHVFKQDGVEWRKPHLVVLEVEKTSSEIRMFVELRDRDTGELTTQLFTCSFEPQFMADVPVALRTKAMLREAYLRLVSHELDELLRLDGQWQDPHDGDTSMIVNQTS